jgi:hypothetical protein
MWAAHFLFHLNAGWGSASTAIRRAVSDVGWHQPRLSELSSPFLGSGAMHICQTLSLDAGLLLALYLAWRIALAYAPRARDALYVFAPWAVVATALYMIGVWIILQPMEMRGLMNPLSFK